MTTPPPMPGSRPTVDAEHLNLLAIFHFIGAGLALIGLLFLTLQVLFFRAVFTNVQMQQHVNGITGPQGVQHFNPPPPFPSPHFPFDFFLLFFVIFGLVLFASMVLNILSGCFLLKRKHRTFSIVVACLNCLHIPLGTILGVFTLVVLVRDSVRELYETQRIR